VCFPHSCSSTSWEINEQPSVWHQVEARQVDRFRLCRWHCLAQRCTQWSTGHDNKLHKQATKLGLCISCEKTKTKSVGTEQLPPVTIGPQTVEYVDNFRYPGSYISRIGDAEVDTRTRLGKAASVYQQLHPVWTSNTINTSTKLHLYKSVMIWEIWSINCHNTWHLS